MFKKLKKILFETNSKKCKNFKFQKIELLKKKIKKMFLNSE